jgi:hypothetical protein
LIAEFHTGPLGREAAETLALSVLEFLSARPNDLDRFLALTGIESGTIRQSARQPEFLGGVLDHLLGDERLLMAFAAWADVPPEDIARARYGLEGAD